MLLESVESVLEEFIQMCIVDCIAIQSPSCLLVIALEWSTEDRS